MVCNQVKTSYAEREPRSPKEGKQNMEEVPFILGGGGEGGVICDGP